MMNHNTFSFKISGIGGRFIGQDNEASMQSIDKLFYEKEQPFAAWFGPTIAIGNFNSCDTI